MLAALNTFYLAAVAAAGLFRVQHLAGIPPQLQKRELKVKKLFETRFAAGGKSLSSLCSTLEQKIASEFPPHPSCLVPVQTTTWKQWLLTAEDGKLEANEG